MKSEKKDRTRPASGFNRRTFLTMSGALAGAGLVAGRAWADDVPAAQKLEKTDLSLGFIPLTDCAPLIIASEKGLYKKYGLNVRIKKMASWGATRDAIQKGEIDGAHILLGMIVGATLGVGDVNSPAKKVPMCVLQCLNLNGQAITLRKKFLDAGIKTPADFKKQIDAGEKYTFAMTFPPGTHAMWMRYWLAAGGIHPDKDVKLITIPPPQMVANMKTGNMDGYCVGEPWGARAIADGIGYTAVTTQQIWKDHPEKVLAFTLEFAEKNPKTVKAILRAMFEASQHIDKLENRAQMAEVVSQPQYINTQKEVILGRMLGHYDYGDGRKEEDPNYMTFFVRNTNYPWKSHGVWWLTQFRRWGMVAEPPDYKALVDQIVRPDIHREVAKEMSIALPKEDMKKETLFDGVEFDPAKPEEYVKKFPVKNVAYEKR